jgi:serine/threonine protein kinase
MPPNPTHKDFQTIKKLTPRGERGNQNQGIYLAKHLASNKVYVEKRVVLSGYAKREVKAMQQYRQHPHLVCIFTFTFSQHRATTVSIYMQHCELGSLDELMMRYNAHNTRLQDEGFLFRIFWHLALAMCFLCSGHDYADTRQRAFQGKSVTARKRGWVPLLHCDIKPANIFMTRDREYVSADSNALYPCIVLGDFGCVVSPTDVYTGQGDPRFKPPENGINMNSDVYGVGVVLHYLARMARVPEGIDMQKPLGRQYAGCGRLAQMVRSCLAQRPEQRPSPVDLPMMVFEGYRVWRQERGRDGQPLPKWAFG